MLGFPVCTAKLFNLQDLTLGLGGEGGTWESHPINHEGV